MADEKDLIFIAVYDVSQNRGQKASKMKKPVYYSTYLQLDQILEAQQPLSQIGQGSAHDETLFIITHQAFELWFKQIHHELDSIQEMFEQPNIEEERLSIIVHRLQRIAEIQKVMIAQFSILETMTPLDFLDFRDALIPASGFQSLQFKQLEKKLGILHQHAPSTVTHMEHALSQPDQEKLKAQPDSLFLSVQAWLERNPFLQLDGYDFQQAYQNSISSLMDQERELIEKHGHLEPHQKEVELSNVQAMQDRYHGIFEKNSSWLFTSKALQSALFIQLYRHYPLLHMPYQVLRNLAEIDQLHTAWKESHLRMVKKIIGMKMGTGGSSGQSYLKKSASITSPFAELSSLATFLVPRRAIPPLPPVLEKKLHFVWG
jgi:tryptophan 2,3-dioxygenase